jgi:hypothetical protein
MWRLYCRDNQDKGEGQDKRERRDKREGQGVAVQSTLGRIKACVAGHELIISPITHEGPAFNDELVLNCVN